MELIASEFVIMQYGRDLRLSVIVKATKFNKRTGLPVSWVVKMNQNSAMSKKTGKFVFEPMPSDRDEDYLSEHRFRTPQAAVRCFHKLFKDEDVFPGQPFLRMYTI